jgi:glucoamylase
MAMYSSILKFIILSILVSNSIFAQGKIFNFEQALKQRTEQAKKHLWANISPVDTPAGFIIASPSRVDPDYFFHWVRDAALVMKSLDLITDKNDGAYLSQINKYAQLENHHQKIFKLSDQGEPKFNPDGTSFQGPWGRPQNDGPALRTSFFSQIALNKLSQGDSSYFRKFYTANLPARSLLKIDFEYISHQWHRPDFDLWEEIQGQHFYTRMVQAHSLKLAGKIAEIAKDLAAKSWYEQQAELIEKSLLDHVNTDKIILSTVKRVGGLPTKKSLLDSSVILAVLHTDNVEGKLGLKSEEILKTFMVLDETFKRLYPINQQRLSQTARITLGTAIGRYPEDTFFGGNPWFLLTSTFAEFSYRQSQLWKTKIINLKKYDSKTAMMLSRFLGINLNASTEALSKAWKAKGDQYLARVLFHTDSEGRQSEQMDKTNGQMKGAHDLTWSYAAFLTAVHYRQKI